MMLVHFGLELLKPEWKSAIVCIGTFDGVHLGHRSVIGAAVERGRALELPTVVVTFDRHPAAVLNPEKCPKAIGSLSQNLAWIASQGVSATVVLPFNAWLSRMSAERFLRELLIGAIRAESVVVGHDFAMGNGREGDTNWLSQRIGTTVIEPFELDGIRTSSSQIRHSIERGEMEFAARMLGRPFQIEGVVVSGQKLGRTIGFPTLNLARGIDQVMPPFGVYVGEVDGYRAAVSIGMRPAVQGDSRTIEAYLLDYPGEPLYSSPVRMDLFHRLRGEENFSSLDALTHQISLDVEACRNYAFPRVS